MVLPISRKSLRKAAKKKMKKKKREEKNKKIVIEGKRRKIREEASAGPVRVVSDRRRFVENNKTRGGVIDLGEKPAPKKNNEE